MHMGFARDTELIRRDTGPQPPHPLKTSSLRFLVVRIHQVILSLLSLVVCSETTQNHLDRLPVIEKKTASLQLQSGGEQLDQNRAAICVSYKEPLVQRDERASVHSRLHVLYKTE